MDNKRPSKGKILESMEIKLDELYSLITMVSSHYEENVIERAKIAEHVIKQDGEIAHLKDMMEKMYIQNSELVKEIRKYGRTITAAVETNQ